MKFSKADNNRVYVSKYKETEERGGLYKTPKSKDNGKEALEEQITKRINNANRLYGVFFAADYPRDLEEHFKRIVCKVRESNGADVRSELKNYGGYKNSKNKYHSLKAFSYPSAERKNPRRVMNLYVRERMEDFWQSEPYRDAAVEILLCICDGKNYKESIDGLSKDTLDDFEQACLKCQTLKNGEPNIFIRLKGENNDVKNDTLEAYFSALLQTMAWKSKDEISVWLQDDGQEKKKKILEKKIRWMENLESLSVKGKNKSEEVIKVPLEEIHYEWATTDRLEAVLVRMRHSLKRGSNGEAAIALMQGLARMDNKSLKSVIRDMREDPEQHEKLKKFVDAVLCDYYHVNARKSIRRTDVKVQPTDQTGENELLALSNEGKAQKAALNETLLAYASSEEESDRVLSDLKELLMDYFCVEDSAPQKFWSFPDISDEFFDSSFKEDGERKGDREAGRPLKELWEESNYSAIKDRIRYVNYGRYLQCLERADSEFEKYWLKFIKEFVENNYTGKRKVSRDGCFKTSMLSACWRDIIRFLCGKYIDLGKAVYHFAMPEDMPRTGEVSCGLIRDEYKEGISSFDYEAIKAEETLQRDISVVTSVAVSSLSSSIIDEDRRAECIEKENGKAKKERKHLEDIMFIEAPVGEDGKKADETVLWDMVRPDAEKQLLRFYGGSSSIKEIKKGDFGREFICELISHLKKIRNENFHYTAGKEITVKTDYTELLWRNEQKAYLDLVRKRYYSNNTGMFYSEGNLRRLVEKLYGNDETAESQIPAFRNVWKRTDLSKEISAKVSKKTSNSGFQTVRDDETERKIFGNSLYFLLKEIYYNDFVLNSKAKQCFFKAAEQYVKNHKDDRENGRAVKDFNEYITHLKDMDDTLTFGGICQMILREYNQQNTKKGKQEIFKHYKMLFPVYVKEAFKEFLKENGDDYGFLMNPLYRDMSKEEDFLKDASVPSREFPEEDKQIAAWYTLAHFIHPRQLNLLIGDFKSYIQYRQDIARRMDCAQEIRDKDKTISEVRARTRYAQSVLSVLEFVRVTAGRVSNVFSDYYIDENAYADYLSQYIQFDRLESTDAFGSLKVFCQNTLPDGAAIDIYADDKNPKVLRNVELARMYAGGDIPLTGREPVSAEEIRDYYGNRDEVDEILNKGLCGNQEDQQKVVDQQRARGRITLNDVTDMYAIVSDLLGELISLSYLRERDQMYLLLGFYYMATHSGNGWEGEELRSADLSKYNVKEGLVLYQVVGIYDYGIEMPFYDGENKKWKEQGGALPGKYLSFHDMHPESMDRALRLFGKETRLDTAVKLRDYIDHGKYYVDHEKSIVRLYQEAYDLFFSYSQKLRNSVAYNFKSVLERYFVEADLKYDKNAPGFKLEKLGSTKFTYKLQEMKTCKMDAKSSEFLDELTQVLEYYK